MRSPERALQIIARLHSEFEAVLGDAIKLALRRSASAAALHRELELMGYDVDTQFHYIVTARPLEAVFEESLTESDRCFLRELEKEFPHPGKEASNGDRLRNE